MRSNMRNTVAIIIAIVLLSIPLVIIRVSFEIALIGDRPAIEQLRSDMTSINGPASEDVIGQATSWNQKIQTLRAYNTRVWAAPFIPDDWNHINLLPIPKGVEINTNAVILEQLGGEILQLRMDVAKVAEKIEKDAADEELKEGTPNE